MQRQVIIVVKKKRQFVSFSLSAGIVHRKLVAELPLKDGWEEGGAVGESYTCRGRAVLGKVQVGLVGTERDEGRVTR